jgi:hypothetical protein
MHLCFIDESGTPPKPNRIGRRRYFVIAGLIMHEAQWHGVASEVKKLRNRLDFLVRGEIKWRYFGPENTDPDNSVAHLSMEKRNEFRDELFSIVTKRKSLKIVACVASAEAAYEKPYVNLPESLYQFTYKAVTERFQYFLQDISRTLGDTQLGVIVADHRGKNQDEFMRRHHHVLIDHSDPFSSSYANYIETVFLTPSHRSVGIQLADMIAGATGRAFNTNDARLFDILRPSFRASPQGNIEGYGLAKFPKDTWR